MSQLPPGVMQSSLDDPPYSLQVQNLDQCAKAIAHVRGILSDVADQVDEKDGHRLEVMRDALLDMQKRMEQRVEAGEEAEPFDFADQ